MDFSFSLEQKILLDSVDKFCRREITPIVEEFEQNKTLHDSSTLKGWLRKLASFGAINGPLPEQYGGMGLDCVTTGLVHERIAESYITLQGCCIVTVSNAWALAATENDRLKQKYLPGVCSGDLIICGAITEPNVGSNPASIETTIKKVEGGYILNGAKTWISMGSVCDIALVTASIDRKLGAKGLAQILVDREQSPFKSRELEKLGWKGFPTAELHFEDLFIPEENLIVPPGEGLKTSLNAIGMARTLTAISATGVSRAAIALSVDYAKQRQQFGRPIASFQLIQAKIADMRARTDAGALLAYRALSMIDQGQRCLAESSMAKFYATEASVQTTSDCIQILGSYGLSTEYPAERFFRDARLTTIPDGTSEIHKLIVGREMTGISAFV